MREQTRKLFKKTEKFKEVRRHRGYNQIMMSSGRSTFGGEHGGMPRNNTANVSFFEIVESKAGFCYNLKQIFRYEKPSQEELRAFLFSDSEPYNPDTSCSTAPAVYQFSPACRTSTVPTFYNSTGYTCINRTSYTLSNYPTLDCSGPPSSVSPPTPVPTTWCKPYGGSLYTASTYACLVGDFMMSSPESGLISLSVNLKTPDQLCPNPNGPVAGAVLVVQPCYTDRTCRQAGSSISLVSECVTAGEPVPPPSGQPPTSAPA
jgi:hypothetical protein